MMARKMKEEKSSLFARAGVKLSSRIERPGIFLLGLPDLDKCSITLLTSKPNTSAIMQSSIANSNDLSITQLHKAHMTPQAFVTLCCLNHRQHTRPQDKKATGQADLGSGVQGQDLILRLENA
jgi:hypothetical protein